MAHRHQNVSDVSGLKVLPLSSATNTDIRAWPDMQYCQSSVSALRIGDAIGTFAAVEAWSVPNSREVMSVDADQNGAAKPRNRHRRVPTGRAGAPTRPALGCRARQYRADAQPDQRHAAGSLLRAG